MDDQTIADWLGKARRYLEEHGWVQGQMGDRGGAACAVGALLYCNGDQQRVTSYEVAVLTNYLASVGSLGLGWGVLTNGVNNVLTMWNDRPGRTAQEVIDLFAKGEKVAIAGFDPDKGVEV